MAKNVLPVDFQDDILAESMNGRRKYQMITNSDGTVSFVDVTEYKQVGSNFGQAQVNATNEAVNESADKNKIIDDKDDLVANSQAGMMAGALAVKAIREELNQNMSNYYNKSQVDDFLDGYKFRILQAELQFSGGAANWTDDLSPLGGTFYFASVCGLGTPDNVFACSITNGTSSTAELAIRELNTPNFSGPVNMRIFVMCK